MQCVGVDTNICVLEQLLYDNLNRSSPLLGRSVAIPVALCEGVLEVIRLPLGVIEAVVRAVFNGLGCLFIPQCKLKDAIIYTERAFKLVLVMPVSLTMIPLKIFYQIIAILINPKEVKCFMHMSGKRESLSHWGELYTGTITIY